MCNIYHGFWNVYDAFMAGHSHGKGEFHHKCPWWMGYILISPLRRIWHNPARILSGLVSDGMTVLEVGPGMGFFSLELAKLVGATGRVVAVDVERKMLDALGRRAKRAGLAERFDLRLAGHDGLGITDLPGRVGFILAFWVVHELPDTAVYFREAVSMLKPGGTMLFSEPAGRVKQDQFDKVIRQAEEAGLSMVGTPDIPRSRSALLVKKAG